MIVYDGKPRQGRLMMVLRSTQFFREAAVDFGAGLLIFLAIYGLAIIDSQQAWPAPTGIQVQLVHHQQDAANAPNRLRYTCTIDRTS